MTQLPPALAQASALEIGEYCVRKEREARALAAALVEARLLRNDPEEIAYLEYLLELARYVGD